MSLATCVSGGPAPSRDCCPCPPKEPCATPAPTLICLQYLELLGIPRSQVVPYNASLVYCAGAPHDIMLCRACAIPCELTACGAGFQAACAVRQPGAPGRPFAWLRWQRRHRPLACLRAPALAGMDPTCTLTPGLGTCPADRLLVPTPTPRITPPREALGLVRQGLGVQILPEASAQLLGRSPSLGRRERPCLKTCTTAWACRSCRVWMSLFFAAVAHRRVCWSGHLAPMTTSVGMPLLQPHSLCCLQAERDLLIYVSRAAEPSRRVANEDALLAGAHARRTPEAQGLMGACRGAIHPTSHASACACSYMTWHTAACFKRPPRAGLPQPALASPRPCCSRSHSRHLP